ncbi:hypothetical protein GC176_16355 [bacterium]|nr:hypothetical protein [bacterium]
MNRSASITFTEAVERLTVQAQELNNRVDGLEAQNAVEALDREWEQERRSYVIRTKNRGEHIPTESGAIVDGVFCMIPGVFGISFGTFIVSSGPLHDAKWVFIGFGLLFILWSLAMMHSRRNKAQEFKIAEYQYLNRRAELLQQLDQ